MSSSSSSSKPWNITLSNGLEMPVLGLGTFQAQGDEVKQSIRDSLDIGYRHFDTADFYKVIYLTVLFKFEFIFNIF